MVPEGGVLHGVLGGQGDAAEQDEEEDQVGEDGVIDDTMALEAEPAGAGGGGCHTGWGLCSFLVHRRCADGRGMGPSARAIPPQGRHSPTLGPTVTPPRGLGVMSDPSGTSASSCTAVTSFTSFHLGTRLPIIKNTDFIRSTSHVSVRGAAGPPRAWMMPGWLSPDSKEIGCHSSNSILNLRAVTEASSPDPGGAHSGSSDAKGVLCAVSS